MRPTATLRSDWLPPSRLLHTVEILVVGVTRQPLEPPAKKNRGRPPGSGKRQMDALGGVGGVGFTPHVITVKTGEDIASKIMAFSQQGPRTVCILSANGAICNVTLRQPAMSGGTVTYEAIYKLLGLSPSLYFVKYPLHECETVSFNRFEFQILSSKLYASSQGRFEIISLSGSFLLSEDNGSRSRSGGLSVSLAGSDGRVLGGGVAGMLLAASPVQVIVGSFMAEGKKSNSNILTSGPSSATTPHMLNFGAPVASSPPSNGGSSDSSDENGSSPLNRAGGLFNNPSQPIHNMHMYHLWSGQTSQ
ncbi:hypothetical protein Patl1_03488 [Pistacia atlantica]|uniref:Uncharacterized protein n=1 Tax=Pistacia atlantica TaxID=434234 RepID=A0ACC1C8F2_9ROSI|nr:hypothetical protein Patl1_03488 [Pistacia atlantica]